MIMFYCTCSGLDKRVSLYQVSKEQKTIETPKKVVAAHTSYVTDTAFLGSDQQVNKVIDRLITICMYV